MKHVMLDSIACKKRRELILRCLNDKDESIQRRALMMLPYAVSTRSLIEIVNRVDKLPVSVLMARSIIDLCSANEYSCLSDWKWYCQLLTSLAQRMANNGISASVVAIELLNIFQSNPNKRGELLAFVEALIDCDDASVRSVVTYLSGQYGEMGAAFKILQNVRKVSPELPYALLKQAIANRHLVTSIDRTKFIDCIGEICDQREESTNGDLLEMLQRCGELCAFPVDENSLWAEELPKLMDLQVHNCEVLEPLSVPPELRPNVDDVPTLFSIAEPNDVPTDVVKNYEGKVTTCDNESVKVWFEVRHKDKNLIVHICTQRQPPDIESTSDLKFSASPSAEWKDQLFVCFKKIKRVDHSHVCLYYRVSSIAYACKLMIDTFWKNIISKECEKIASLTVSLNVSDFLLPFSDKTYKLANKCVFNIPVSDTSIQNRITSCIPAFVSVGLHEVRAQTLFDQKVCILFNHANICIESEDFDFGTSLTDELRLLISRT